MKKYLTLFLLSLMRFALSFRYRVTIKGLEHINSKELSKPGGILFLPNHPTIFVDPTLVTLAILKKVPVRAVIVEYMYYTPIIHTVMKFLNAMPIPQFVSSSNSLKRKRTDEALEAVISQLKEKVNFLIYPAGKTKHQAREVIGASGVHRIIQSAPEVNVVLVRTTGLWGSKFSRALTAGAAPEMFPTILWGIKKAFKNLLFFTPRRNVTIEFHPAPSDFPYQASRLEMNRYLEKWYNRPDGILPHKGEEPGESLYLVSYSMWREELPEVRASQKIEADIDIASIPNPIQEQIKHKLSEMTQMPENQIQPNMDLSGDLGLDSLDNAELLTFLDDHYEVIGVPVNELTTVGKVMAIAAKQITFEDEIEQEDEKDLTKWFLHRKGHPANLAKGNSLPEVFLNNCSDRGRQAACGDKLAGVLSYADLKLRALLLAEYIRQFPGEYIGIMLPSSVAAYVTILACQIAGKVPLMINWTVGPRHLESVASVSQVKVILSSWSFLDRLENVDLNGIEDLIVMLEDVRRKFSLKDKIRAFYRSKLSTKRLLSIFNLQKLAKDSQAVLLFTSGTENMPKGVPLTHENILSNQRGSLDEVALKEDDILLGILPPFHSFGFTLTGLLPLLSGIRVAYYADPNDGRGLAHAIEKWQATLVCGAPSFLKGIFKNGDVKQLRSLNLCVTGAEKAPDDLFAMVAKLKRCLLLEGYGITECSPVITVNMTGDPKKGVGFPIKETELLVISLEEHVPLPPSTQGLILVRGPGVFKGYLNKGIASPFLTVNGKEWYSTGDLGHLDEQGNLTISGRLKRFIKIGGEMISLASLEDAMLKTIAKNIDIQEGPPLAVCAKEEAGERTKIFVFTRFPSTIEEVNRSLKESGFSNLVKVYKVKQVEEIPLMGTGKTNYRALEAQIPTLIEQTVLQ